MEKILISIITSEKTWKNFSKFGFDKQVIKHRDKFDFAVVLNGYALEAINYYKDFKPEFFFLRPNLGFDPAAVEHLIKIIPVYDTTLILNDDYWFEVEDWVSQIEELRIEKPEIDVWGNLVVSLTSEMVGYNEYCSKADLGFLKNYDSKIMLQGMSGIFSSDAITKLKTINYNFFLENNKQKAELGERIFSNFIKYSMLNMSCFPQGIFKFLLHNDTNEKDHLFWTANELVLKNNYIEARNLYLEYLKHCERNESLLAFYNIAQISSVIKDYETTMLYCKKCLEIVPAFPLVTDLLNKIEAKFS
ncbi:MAG: hypothetical protein PVH88_25055 [Ignavibacteria bacterium]|jgi:hypothetical protein